MRTVLLLFACAWAACAQFHPSVLVNTNGTLLFPTNLFDANAAAILSAIGTNNVVSPEELASKLDATNGTSYGTLTISPGGGVALSAGSGLLAVSNAPVVAHTIVVTRPMFAAWASDSEPALVGEMEMSAASLVDDLDALKDLPVPLTRRRRATVIADTITAGISDGARGDWYWNPSSTAAENPARQKSNLLSPSDPGRWIKLP